MKDSNCQSQFRDDNGELYHCALPLNHDGLHDSHPGERRRGCMWRADSSAAVESGLTREQLLALVEREQLYERMCADLTAKLSTVQGQAARAAAPPNGAQGSERKAFEKYWMENRCDIPPEWNDDYRGYHNPVTEEAWLAWQARGGRE